MQSCARNMLVDLTSRPVTVRLLIHVVIGTCTTKLGYNDGRNARRRLRVPALRNVLLGGIGVLLGRTPLGNSSRSPITLFGRTYGGRRRGVGMLFGALGSAVGRLTRRWIFRRVRPRLLWAEAASGTCGRYYLWSLRIIFCVGAMSCVWYGVLLRVVGCLRRLLSGLVDLLRNEDLTVCTSS